VSSPRYRLRAVSGPATAAMIALAGAAAVDLLWAFTPLAAVWAVHEAARRGGGTPGVVILFSYVGVLALLGLTHLFASILLARWVYRATANARVLGWSRRAAGPAAAVWFIPLANWVLPPLVVSAVARASGWRQSGLRVWSWWLAWTVGGPALIAGTALTWPAELTGILSKAADGATVDLDRAGELLGYQIAGRLPGAVLLLAAAVLGIVVVHAVTTAQYDRFDELRAGSVSGPGATVDGQVAPSG
jgi:hypothetical protein